MSLNRLGFRKGSMCPSFGAAGSPWFYMSDPEGETWPGPTPTEFRTRSSICWTPATRSPRSLTIRASLAGRTGQRDGVTSSDHVKLVAERKRITSLDADLSTSQKPSPDPGRFRCDGPRNLVIHSARSTGVHNASSCCARLNACAVPASRLPFTSGRARRLGGFSRWRVD